MNYIQGLLNAFDSRLGAWGLKNQNFNAIQQLKKI